MRQSKFSIADLLTVLGAVGFGFFCFLSLNFLSFGDTNKSIIGAIVIASILLGLAFGAKLLKGSSRNFKTCIIWEWMFLFLFTGMICFILNPFSQSFAVSAQKAEIQKKVIANLEQAEALFKEYETYANSRLNIYEGRLKSVAASRNINAEYRRYDFVDGIDFEIQIKNKMYVLNDKLFPSNYLEMKSIDSTWLASAKSTIANWKEIGVVKVLKDVKKNATVYKNELNKFSLFRAQGEIATDFEYPLTFDDVTDKFTKLGGTTITSIAAAIGLYGLMLLSYIFTKRSSKNPYSLLFFLDRNQKNANSDIDVTF